MTRDLERRPGETPPDYEARVLAAAAPAETACGDGRMVWRRWGDAQRPPLVLLHGGYGSWRHWIRNVGPLSAHHAVWVPDLPGLGDSDRAPGEYDLESLAPVVASGIEALLGPGARFDMAGFSFGGLLGGHVAAQMGDAVRCFVVVGSGGLGPPLSRRPEMQSLGRHLSDRERAEVHRFNLSQLMLADPNAVDDLAVYLQTETVRRARERSRNFAQSDRLGVALERTTCRLAGVWGSADALSGFAVDQRIARLRAVRPDAPAHIVEGAGHWVMYERPAEVNRILLELLGNETPTPSIPTRPADPPPRSCGA